MTYTRSEVEEAVEILVGEPPDPPPPGEPRYVVRDRRELYWRSQDVLVHWVHEAERASPLTWAQAELLAAEYPEHGAIAVPQ